MIQLRGIVWVGDCLQALRELPEEVKDEIGFTLYQVQKGLMPRNVKPFKGFGSGVMEIISDFNTNAYRAVYAVKIGDEIYVLHTFNKKSKKGIKTPQKDVELIGQRLKMAKMIEQGRKVKYVR